MPDFEVTIGPYDDITVTVEVESASRAEIKEADVYVASLTDHLPCLDQLSEYDRNVAIQKAIEAFLESKHSTSEEY